MARELSALLQVLRQKKQELGRVNAIDILRNPKAPTGIDRSHSNINNNNNPNSINSSSSADRRASIDNASAYKDERRAIIRALLATSAGTGSISLSGGGRVISIEDMLKLQPMSFYLRPAHEYIVEFHDAFS
jgi:hypothetical protein